MIVTENKKNYLFSDYDPFGVKVFKRLRLQKFRHGFGDTVNPICECNAEIEDTEHFIISVCLFLIFHVCKFNIIYLKKKTLDRARLFTQILT